MTSKREFVLGFQDRTLKYAIDVIMFLRELTTNFETSVIKNQLIKSVTSIGANYRAASVSRSRKEFYSKMCVVVEEADETIYWMELIDGLSLKTNVLELVRLKREGLEILKIVTKARNNSKNY